MPQDIGFGNGGVDDAPLLGVDAAIPASGDDRLVGDTLRQSRLDGRRHPGPQRNPEVDLGKAEIRELSRRAGLPTWDEPASACLSSRIPYFHEVTGEKLRTIETAENALRALGFRVCRVRHHDELARIELGREEMPRALEPEMSAAIVEAVKAAGYRFVTIDLQGYRTGSLNEGLLLTPTLG